MRIVDRLHRFLFLALLGVPTGATAIGSPEPAGSSSPMRPPVETGPFRGPDLVELVALDPTIRLDVRYATADNFTGRPVYPAARVFLQRPAAEALARAQQALRREGYGLLVFDGYRPWTITKLFWDLTPREKKVFVADPAKGSKHNRGCAVDLTLFDLTTGREVAMPGEYDEMSERSYPTYGGGSAEARSKRELLRSAMEREGFFVYTHEWWHFDYKDWREYPVLDLSFADIDAASARRTAPLPPPVDLGAARLIDLSWTFDATTLYWPTATSGFELERGSSGMTERGYFYAANAFRTPEHGGTHLDAPSHFARNGAASDAIPLERLVGPAVVIDISERAASDPDARLTAEEVRRWEARHGLVPRRAIVLLRTGWGRRWPERKRYFGDDTPGDASRLHFPSFGKDAAELLILERDAAALGVDTPSLDHGPARDFPVHIVAAEAGVPGFENLARLEELPPTGAWVVALPMKIGGGTGGPLRAIALLPPR